MVDSGAEVMGAVEEAEEGEVEVEVDPKAGVAEEEDVAVVEVVEEVEGGAEVVAVEEE